LSEALRPLECVLFSSHNEIGRSQSLRAAVEIADSPFFISQGGSMNLTISGHHLEVTPAIRDYVSDKLDRVKRHFDHVITINVIMQVEKLVHKVEATLHVKGHDFHAHSEDGNMYAAIDLLADKLDRQIVKHKEKTSDVHQGSGGLKHQPTETPA
jgi:putative sigma-54 modulation protein